MCDVCIEYDILTNECIQKKNNDYDWIKIVNSNNELSVFLYAKLNNLKIVEKILDSFSTFDFIDNAIGGACRGGHYDLFLFIVKKYIYDNLKLSINKIYYFYNACCGGNIDIINYFIKINVYNFNYGLIGACVGKQKEIVKLMINYDAILPQKFISNHECKWYNYLKKICLWLLENGITRKDLKNVVSQFKYNLNFEKEYQKIEKINEFIKKKVDKLLIKELENIVIEYICI